MTNETSQGLFVIVAVVIFGIFVFISYLLFRDTLKPSLSTIFTDGLEQAERHFSGKDTDSEELFGNSRQYFGTLLVMDENRKSILGSDIEQSGDAIIGGIKSVINNTNNSYDIIRTYDTNVSYFTFSPRLVAFKGIKKIEVANDFSLDVPDSEKMNQVSDILKNHEDTTNGTGIFFSTNNGESLITKNNPYKTFMKVIDTEGNVFTIKITIKVQ